MAGVIQYFARETNWTPALGLWKEDFAASLLWSHDEKLNTTSTRVDSSVFYMPTRSWLSLIKGVNYDHPGRHRRYTARVPTIPAINFDLRCDWEGPELTGRLVRADLEITGVLEIVKVTSRNESDALQCSLVNGTGPLEDVLIDTQNDLADLLRPGATATLLQICVYHSKHWSTWRDGLLLKRVGKAGNIQTFERIGIGSIRDRLLEDGTSHAFRGHPETIKLL
ncbi:uncharacterized protein BDZ99DRAFT_465332 [Mytilinidion resinicola]|uniref:Uncharacterized protein n=1 Tax=Mytilinidion resinicola TaxID=574789 RepID=A0A6A6YF95_9PEZI|nr:uncharacterized protein BDZ99DRAFT_465332 [Mytilinidion resinicola]KAF2807462.1 hypothetical protein BDZ99DRAFT_465332 [Mytilinidion resinicola]